MESPDTTPALPTRRVPAGWGALAGVVAAGLAVAVASLVAAITDVVLPLDAVGSEFIDHTPRWLKQWAIETFGTDDKLALRTGMWFTIFAIAAGVGALAASRRWVGWAGMGVFGVAGAWIAAGRPGQDWGAAVPALLGAVAGGFTLQSMLRPRPIEVPGRSQAPLGWDRRRFFAATGGAAAGAVVAGAFAKAIDTRRIEQVVADTAQPLPDTGVVDPAPPAPDGTQLDPSTPFITPNGDFYRIDTALSFPRANVDDWSFTIDGMVDTPLTLTYTDLLAMPQVERTITICCVSNEVGGDLIGNAVWRGVLLRDLLDQAGVQPEAEQVYSTSLDGWTCGFPVEAAFDGRDAMVAVGMNGSALPLAHGYPARLIVPGLYGYVSATKWLSRIELTNWEKEGYWIPRGWSREGPIKTQSRIGYPRSRARLDAGPNKIAGVAWAQGRGIDKVEVRVDDGPWMQATLGTDVSEDTWRQWVVDWDAAPGKHVIEVRATDGTGETQTEERTSVAPDGATGHHTISVSVG